MSFTPDLFMTHRTYPSGRDVIEVGRNVRASITIERRSSDLRLWLVFDSSSAHARLAGITIAIQPGSSPVLEVDGIDSPAWHMAAGLLSAASGDVFARVLVRTYQEVVHRQVLPFNPQLELPLREVIRHDSEPVRLVYSRSVVSSMRSVAAILRSAAVHSVMLCDKKILRVVRRFSPCMRPWLYEVIAADRSGRLAQLATTCPGALVFAFALCEQAAMRPIAVDLLNGATAGRRLNRVLGEAVDGWATVASEAADRRHQSRLARPWLRILDAGSEERRRIEAEQRLLVRRAGPRVAPTYVLLPPPLSFAPEDIPAAVRENARWFRVMKAKASLISPHAGQDEALLRELAQFASRSFRALHPPRGKGKVKRRMQQLIEYALAAERHTSRTTCPKRLLAECRQWHRMTDEVLEFCSAAGMPPASAETELSVLQARPWSDGNITVTPIRTVGELIKEARIMRSCVGQRARSALQGRCSFYAIELDGRRITVELTHMPNGRLFVSEAAGFANRALVPAEIQAMEPWLASLGARSEESGAH